MLIFLPFTCIHSIFANIVKFSYTQFTVSVFEILKKSKINERQIFADQSESRVRKYLVTGQRLVHSLVDEERRGVDEAFAWWFNITVSRENRRSKLEALNTLSSQTSR